MNTATRWDCTGEEYHSDPSLGQSSLKLFANEPERFFDEHVARTIPKRPDTSYFEFGKDFERLLFFEDTPGQVIPNEVLASHTRDGKTILSRRGPAWVEFLDRMREEHGDDVRLMRQDEWDKNVIPILIARDRLRGHDRANKLIYGEGEPHVAFRWIDELTGLPCKCQLDMLHGPIGDPRIIVDVKTAASTDQHKYKRAIYDYGYHVQGAWYQGAVERWCGKKLPFVIVAVKNKPSHCVEVFDMEEEWLTLARKKIRKHMRRLEDAYQTGNWHSPTHGRVVTLAPEKWMLYDNS